MFQRLQPTFGSVLIFLCLASSVGAGATPAKDQVVRPGDTVRIHYTCRLANGDILATSSKAVAENSQLKKSKSFFPKKEYSAVDVGIPEEGATPIEEADGIREFEFVLMEEMVSNLTGLAVGDTHRIEVETEPVKHVSSIERYVKMARERFEPKEKQINKKHFIATVEREPEIGETLQFGPRSYRVKRITDDFVFSDTVIPDGTEFETAWGKEIFFNDEGRFRIVVEVNPDRLVRANIYLGRITDIQEKYFVIDFAHPFGGETLTCDVEVLEILSRSPLNLSAGDR